MLTVGISTVSTNMVSLKKGSNRCKDSILTKTLMVSIIDPKTKAKYSVKNGQLRTKYDCSGFYTLLSQDSIISKRTTLFNENVQVTGRSCGVSDSVNSSSTPTGNFLFENYHFMFQGKLKVTEACPS